MALVESRYFDCAVAAADENPVDYWVIAAGIPVDSDSVAGNLGFAGLAALVGLVAR